MIPDRAKALAIQGGFENRRVADHECVLNPVWWQSLGKALGWKPDKAFHNHRGTTMHRRIWLRHAHRFYDLILTGGNFANDRAIKQFWSELLDHPSS